MMVRIPVGDKMHCTQCRFRSRSRSSIHEWTVFVRLGVSWKTSTYNFIMKLCYKEMNSCKGYRTH